MNDNSFEMCIDCSNKQSDAKLQKGNYYCPVAQEILPEGIVSYDTDATECIEKGFLEKLIGQ